MKKSLIAAGIAVAAVALIAAFVLMNKKDNPASSPASSTSSSAHEDNNGSGDTNTSAGSAAETDKVSIKDFAFEQSEIKVKKGTTVTWTNDDSASHTVTGDDGTTPKSGTIKSGGTYSFTFNETGIFAYHCEFHPSMTGKVTVTE